MPKIVKSRAVVGQENASLSGAFPPARPDARVIKRGYFENPAAALSTDYRLLAPKEPYLEELNRLKAEVEEARAELQRLRGNIEHLPPPKPAGETLSDDEAGEPEEHGDETPLIQELPPDFQEIAEQMIREAEQKAREIGGQALLEARKLCDEAKNEGYLEGFNKGYEEAVAEYRRENEPKAERLADLVESLSDYEQNRLRQNEKELIELALGVAAKVIGQELTTKPKTIVKMLSDVVRQNHSEEYIRITLAEDLFPLDVKASEEIRQMLLELGANVSVLENVRVPAGKIQVETPKGIIDMSVDTQLKNIRDILQSS